MIDQDRAIYAVFGATGNPCERVYMDYTDLRIAFNMSTIDLQIYDVPIYCSVVGQNPNSEFTTEDRN